jgi:hypothetical protein
LLASLAAVLNYADEVRQGCVSILNASSFRASVHQDH